jgi:hypothetical protein
MLVIVKKEYFIRLHKLLGNSFVIVRIIIHGILMQ